MTHSAAYRTTINELKSVNFKLIACIDTISQGVGKLFGLNNLDEKVRSTIRDTRRAMRLKETISESLDKVGGSSWTPAPKTYPNNQVELYFDKGTLRAALHLVLVKQLIRVDESPITCYFRVPLFGTSQIMADGATKGICLYRNCFVFAYSGGSNFCEFSPYPQPVNDIVMEMNQQRFGKLFFGFKSETTQSWAYYHVTGTDKSVSVDPPCGKGPLESWFGTQINGKTNVIIIGFDGWDCSG